ncbi:MAG: TetR/AcrR family transcriptional regulator [Clostridiales bacterium]|nr:TetR/AcrR family transcriptional regulator [Clostridiales bacterium]
MKARKKIILALESLLEQKELDCITVSEIITEAKVARKTFYRNFRDKYDLMNWYYDIFYQESFGSIVLGNAFEKALTQCLNIYDSKRTLLKNAYASKDINGLKNHDIEITRKIYETCLTRKGADTSSETMRFAIEIAVQGGSDMVMQWILGNWDISAERLAYYIHQTLPEELKKYMDTEENT